MAGTCLLHASQQADVGMTHYGEEQLRGRLIFPNHTERNVHCCLVFHIGLQKVELNSSTDAMINLRSICFIFLKLLTSRSVSHRARMSRRLVG